MARLFDWVTYHMCAGIVLVAACIRFFRLDFQSVWYDETISTNIARYELWSIAERTAQDTMPPLYYWLVHYSIALWPNDFGARFVSAVAGVVSVALVYALGNQLFGEKVAVLASFITALSPFQVYYAQEARMYTLLGALQLAAILCFALALTNRRRIYWLGFSVFMALAFYTHNMAVLSLVALIFFYLVWLVVGTCSDKTRTFNTPNPGFRNGNVFSFAQLREFLGSLGLIFLLFLPWLAVLPSQVAMVSTSFWDTNFSFWKVLATPYLFILNVSLPAWGQVAGLFLVLLIMVLALRATIKSFTKGVDAEQVSMVLFLMLVPIVLLSTISFAKPIYLERVLIGASFPFYILLSWWIFKIAPRGIAATSGTLVVALMVLGLYASYFMADFWKPPMRDAAVYLARNFQQGDAILHTSDGSYQPFDWYMPDLPHSLANGDPDLQPGRTRFQASVRSLSVEPVGTKELQRRSARIWLVVALDHSVSWQLEQKRWFDDNTKLISEEDFRGIKVILYENDISTEVSG